MAFENVFGNVDFGAPQRQANLEKQQFAQMLGMGMQAAQASADRDFKERQLEAKGKDIDLGKKAQLEVLKMKQGLPYDQSVIEAYSDFKGSQTYIDPITQQMVTNPSLIQRLGVTGGQAAPMQPAGRAVPAQSYDTQIDAMLSQQRPTPDMGQPLSVADLPSISGDEIQPIDMSQLGSANIPYNPPQDVVSDDPLAGVAYKAPAKFGARGEIMEEEFKKDTSLAQAKADIQFRKEQMTTEKGRQKVTGTIEKTMQDLQELNDKLKAKEAIRSNDASTLGNLKALYGTSWLGKETTKVTDAAINSLRQEYETKRDSVIPSYIAYFDIPATVVDTEEMQKRILQSFGDPSLSYEVNNAALDNMRTQFNLPDAKKSDPNPQQSTGGWSIKRK